MQRVLVVSLIQLLLMLAHGARVFAGIIFFADEHSQSIRSANLDGSNVVTVVGGLVAPRGLAIDQQAGKLYWTDGHAVPRTVSRANLDGSNVETLVQRPLAGTLNQIALDVVHGKMYFPDSISGVLLRANLDGTNLETIATGLSDPVGVAVDPVNGHVWWTGGFKTQRANLDGTGIVDVFSFGARDLALDIPNNKVYIGGHGQTIKRSNLDGSGLVTLVNVQGEFSQMGLDFIGQRLYWSDLARDVIYRSHLDGTNIESVITSGLSLPRDIVLLHPSTVPEPSSLAVGSLLGLGGIFCRFRRRKPEAGRPSRRGS